MGSSRASASGTSGTVRGGSSKSFVLYMLATLLGLGALTALVVLAVRQAIDDMTERFRQPLVLRYLNGLTNRQIADALGISVSNVKLRLARAKDVLQSRLAEVKD